MNTLAPKDDTDTKGVMAGLSLAFAALAVISLFLAYVNISLFKSLMHPEGVSFVTGRALYPVAWRRLVMVFCVLSVPAMVLGGVGYLIGMGLTAKVSAEAP